MGPPRHFKKQQQDDTNGEDEEEFDAFSRLSNPHQKYTPPNETPPRTSRHEQKTPLPDHDEEIKVIIEGDKYHQLEGLIKRATDNSKTNAISSLNYYPHSNQWIIGMKNRPSACRLRDALNNYYVGYGQRLIVVVMVGAEEDHNNITENAGGGGYATRQQGKETSIEGQYPRSILHLRAINWCAQHVYKHGPQFEHILKECVRFDDRFEFLFNDKSNEHWYYRWTVARLTRFNGRVDLNHWPTTKVKLMTNDKSDPGCWYKPPVSDEPVMKAGYDHTTNEVKINNNDGTRPVFLGEVRRIHLNVLLRYCSDTRRRGAIARIMGFAIAFDRYYHEIVEIICRSIESNNGSNNDNTRFHRLLAVGDILANVELGHPYRKSLAKRLQVVFAKISRFERGRFSRERFRNRLSNLLNSWHQLGIFSSQNIFHFKELLLLGSNNYYDGKEIDENLKQYYEALII